MSGLVSSYALAFLPGGAAPSLSQLLAAAIIMTALAILMASTLARHQATRAVVRRMFLFVCAGNTSRSPMAQAICNNEIARRLGLGSDWEGDGPMQAVSAGLTVSTPRPFTRAAILTLQSLGIRPHAHASRAVTSELVAQAELVYCMTEDQRRDLIARYPEAAAKTLCLDPTGDIGDPSTEGDEAYLELAQRLQRLVRERIPLPAP